MVVKKYTIKLGKSKQERLVSRGLPTCTAGAGDDVAGRIGRRCLAQRPGCSHAGPYHQSSHQVAAAAAVEALGQQLQAVVVEKAASSRWRQQQQQLFFRQT